jgi:hypothetical protein
VCRVSVPGVTQLEWSPGSSGSHLEPHADTTYIELCGSLRLNGLWELPRVCESPLRSACQGHRRSYCGAAFRRGGVDGPWCGGSIVGCCECVEGGMKRFEAQGGGYRRATGLIGRLATRCGHRSRGDYSQMSAMVARRVILGANWLAPGSIHDQSICTRMHVDVPPPTT